MQKRRVPQRHETKAVRHGLVLAVVHDLLYALHHEPGILRDGLGDLPGLGDEQVRRLVSIADESYPERPHGVEIFAGERQPPGLTIADDPRAGAGGCRCPP